MESQLLEIAHKALKHAEKLGAEQAEVYIASSRSFSIDVENSSIKSASQIIDGGCGIRSLIDKKIGFAYVTNLNEKDIMEMVEQSVHVARASVADPDFVSLPGATGTYPEVKGIFDPAIDGMSSEEATGIIIRTVEATKSAAKDAKTAVEASISSGTSTRAIVNSLGVEGAYKSTSITLVSYPTVKVDGDQNSSFEFQVSRQLKDIDPEWVGTRAGESAIANLGGKTIEGGEMPVILAPLAVGVVLGSGFGEAVNAEEVQHGRSYISDALGEEIANPVLHIVDDGLREGGVGSRPFDAEGAPSKTTPILEKGVLKSLLHNSYTANKDKVENTGNASRPSYAGLPSISSTNMVIEPGKGDFDDLVSEIKRGIFIKNTWDRPNMTTGDLSALVAEGFYIENGSLSHPVKSTLMGINMRDILKRVSVVGADVRVTMGVVSPSLVIESAKVTSG